MKILEKNNYSFTGQSDKLIGWNNFGLFEDDHDEFFVIKQEHLQPLFGTTDNELAIGEYGNNELKLTIVFNLDGIFFEAGYLINLATGVVEFKMDKPMICVKDFVMPADMDPALAGLINDKIKTDKYLVLIDDAELDKYFSDKYLGTFEDYVGYLEGLVSVDV